MDKHDSRLRAIEEASQRRQAALASAEDWHRSVQERLAGRSDRQARAELAAAADTRARLEYQAHADYNAAVQAAAPSPSGERGPLLLPPDDPARARAAMDALEAGRRRREKIFGLSLAGVMAVAVIAVGAFLLSSASTHQAGPVSAAEPVSTYKSTATVEYEVFGDQKSAMVTITTPTGMSQVTPDLPMKLKSSNIPGLTYEFPYGSYVAISAQGRDGYGKVTCRSSAAAAGHRVLRWSVTRPSVGRERTRGARRSLAAPEPGVPGEISDASGF